MRVGVEVGLEVVVLGAVVVGAVLEGLVLVGVVFEVEVEPAAFGVPESLVAAKATTIAEHNNATPTITPSITLKLRGRDKPMSILPLQ